MKEWGCSCGAHGRFTGLAPVECPTCGKPLPGKAAMKGLDTSPVGVVDLPKPFQEIAAMALQRHCLICGGTLTLLGIFGGRPVWRCQDCGADYGIFE